MPDIAATVTAPTVTASSLDDIETMSAATRWRIGLAALRVLSRDPDRLDKALEFSAHVNAAAAPRILTRFLSHPDGVRVYREDRSIDTRSVDLDALAALPDGTLGREYVRFLRSRGLSPDVFAAPPNVKNPTAIFLARRLRQTHDLWHVITGYETDVPGEVELQAFTYAQLGAPSALFLAAAGTLRSGRRAPSLARRAVAAYIRGRRARFFAPIAWEDHWATPVRDLRAALAC